jgi:probable HAF family extracellular repeat protein
MTSLGTLPGGSAASGNGVNADGSVVVGTSDTTGGATRAFRWTSAAGMVNLGTLPGGTISLASAVSADGSVVVGEGDSGANVRHFHAVRWTTGAGGAARDLGTLPGGADSSALGVNGDGSIVVGDATTANPFIHRAFLWTAALGMVDLNFYLATLGIDMSGWTLDEAYGISPDGRSIVGIGAHGSHIEGWVATLPPVCACRGDFNCDGGVNSQDFFEFLGAFLAQDPRADFNIDGAIDSQDFFGYLGGFFGGC